ncbi:MAG TPA: cation diffusion facilitator family transporter [Thermohalobaculum sp.]|nr:cation diffusion facilitator family transporter [Thermohalobaculum sp.]
MSTAAAGHRLNLSAAAASIAVAVCLVTLKLWALTTTGALSIGASLADSVIDLAIALANLAALRYAVLPPDEAHRFGHTAIEDIAALAQSVLVIGSGLLILWGVGLRLANPRPLTDEGVGLAVMLVASALTTALVLWQRRVARRTGSRIVAADSMHYVADLLPNLAAIVALAASAAFGVSGLDSLLAALAALWLMRSGVRLGRASVDALMDREAPEETVARIRAAVGGVPGLRGTHDLKTRMSGTKLFVQFHAEVEGATPLADAHEVGEEARRRILAACPGAEVIIHKDPV